MAVAKRFAAEGHRLILTGRRSGRLLKIKADFEHNYGVKCRVLTFDVRSQKAVEAALNALPENWRNIDLLVNNAGLAKGLSEIHEGDLEHWETMIDTNIKGLLYLTRAITPSMVEAQKGHVINIGSIAGHEVYPKGNVYCGTKHAVEALTKAMRIDLHKYNIRVSSISPGHVETEFAVVRFDGDEEKAKIYEDFQPLKAEDVAESVFFVFSQPKHVNIDNIMIWGTQQATATIINRSGRKKG